MKQITKEEFEAGLRPMDYVIVKGTNVFSKLQAFQAKLKNIPQEYWCSHGAIGEADSKVFEAEFKGIECNPVSRYFSDHHKMWVFRYKGLTSEQAAHGKYYLDSAVENGARYGKAGILQFAKWTFYKLLGKNYNIKDKKGTFCTELLTRVARRVGIIFCPEYDPEEVSPSIALNWLSTIGVKLGMWELVMVYDKGACSSC